MTTVNKWVVGFVDSAMFYSEALADVVPLRHATVYEVECDARDAVWYSDTGERAEVIPYPLAQVVTKQVAADHMVLAAYLMGIDIPKLAPAMGTGHA